MGAKKKLVLVHVGNHAAADDSLELQRLCDALRARGAVIEECALDADPDALLDHIEAGAVPVVFRTA